MMSRALPLVTIQSLNDFGADALNALSDAVEHLRAVVRDRDEAGFEALMERGRAYLRVRRNAPGPPLTGAGI